MASLHALILVYTVLQFIHHLYGLPVTPDSLPEDAAVGNISRQHGGDYFGAIASSCRRDTCVGLSSGTAELTEPPGLQATTWGSATREVNPLCTCKCHEHLPVFREDANICVDDIHECTLASFVSGSTVQKIPFVFLPLRGQIIHPSKEISFEGVQNTICAVSGAQFLTRKGWVELRNPLDTDVPFKLFRDEGRTFLQWFGESDLRIRMEGRLILVHMLCRASSPNPEVLQQMFTPCVAFRVVGSPTKYINNEEKISEVVFAPDTQSKEDTSSGGLGVNEYVAIGVCSILLGLIYVASVFLYLHLKRRRQKQNQREEKEIERREVNKNVHMVSPEEGIIKNNPLIGMSRHFPMADNNSFLSDSASCPSDNDLTQDLRHEDKPRNHHHQHVMQMTSAIVHPSNQQQQHQQQQQQQQQHQQQQEISEMATLENHQLDSSGIECLPEENVSIVEELEGREDRPENVKAIINGTARRKLYFNPAYFEPHLLLAPPPAAIEFLTKIREVIAIAKHKMAAKRYIPNLMGIPEEDLHHSIDYSHGRLGSRRSSAVSLKRENSRRRNGCTGCPGCEPQNLQELCGKLPNFPAIGACQTCTTTGDSKQRSIRKWLEDVPVMKNNQMHDDLMPEAASLHSTALAKSLMALTNEGKALGRANVFIGKKPERSSSPFNHIIKSPINRIKSTELERSRTPSPSSTLSKKKPHIPESITPFKMLHLKNEANAYDTVLGVRPVNNLSNGMPDMINEAMAVDVLKNKQPPGDTKEIMDAVINEFEENTQNLVSSSPQEYETDSLERTAKKGHCTPPDYTDLSSQPSPSLSSALPMEEELTMRNAIYDIKTGTKIDKAVQDSKPVEKGVGYIGLNQGLKVLEKRFNLPELLQSNEEYSLVSEVYVNNGYNFGSTPTSPSGSDSSFGSRKAKIKYKKPGHLTIEVEDSPENYIKVNESDNFEPDTLDRKPSKMKLSVKKNRDVPNGKDSSDSLERPGPGQILLRTTGSFKSDSLTCSSEIGTVVNRSNFNRNFGSLREIYEARTKNYPRPSLNGINFMGSTQSLNRSEDGTMSWKRGRRIKDSEEGKILTLEARHSKRQRRSNEVIVKPTPPDVVLPAKCDSIYQHPKPPRKVIQEFKPPLPPKHGKINNISTSPIESPSSTISYEVPSSASLDSSDELYSIRKSQNERNILRNFILNNGNTKHFNNQFIFQAGNVFPSPKLDGQLKPIDDDILDDELISAGMQIALGLRGNLTKNTKREINDNSDVKKTWRRLVELASNKFYKPEDSGYLSTDSNDSNFKRKQNQTVGSVSETDESLCDGHSESGAESVETHSVFFGNYRKIPMVGGSVDSGVGSDLIRSEILMKGRELIESESDEDMSMVTVRPHVSSTQSTLSGSSRDRRTVQITKTPNTRRLPDDSKSKT